ncbi:MAG: transporter substrate-binding protein, partial [Mariprofundaceae bacterium]|nr:transporter substrate-binding protein [Mariprofundaceae bacterium]
AAEGIIAIDQNSHHVWKTLRIGRIRSDQQFDILWSSERAIRPSPYPAVVSKLEANRFLEQLYRGWDNHWHAPRGDVSE